MFALRETLARFYRCLVCVPYGYFARHHPFVRLTNGDALSSLTARMSACGYVNPHEPSQGLAQRRLKAVGITTDQ